MLRNEVMQEIINQNDLTVEGLRYRQGYIQAIDSYLELEDALDQFKLVTEADKARMDQFKQATSITSQAEAMGII